ncbi:MAG: hypothetical protein RUMPE_00492 [Eubacteriales bacterium SKADARSKE-1]|nr:hypothetical protein [Eubacteriales bacterium SKADARSKE-1]
MKIEIDDENKILAFWFANGENSSDEMPQMISTLIEKYRRKKYIIAVYKSGDKSLKDLTTELVLANYRSINNALA